jgi:threonine dehydrogenase-like Zn-dependent dehydrogenase
MLEGAWAEPISIALRGVSRSGFGIGQRTVVIGAGPIGLLTTMLLRHGGASDITVIEPSEMRRAKAEEVGADLTINPFDDDPTAIFGADLEMPDHVFECSGAYTAVDTAVDIVRPHGRVTLVGVASGAVSFHSLRALTKEVTIRSTSRNADEIVTATRLLARKALDVQALTSAVVPLEGALDALERLAQGNAIKILVQPTE